jgi:hypothetical protein
MQYSKDLSGATGRSTAHAFSDEHPTIEHQATRLRGHICRFPQDYEALRFQASLPSLFTQPIYSMNVVSLPPKKKAVVVQLSAHPIWYPKFLRSLTYKPNSLSRGSGGRWFESSPRCSIYLFASGYREDRYYLESRAGRTP